jgi:type I site-specific restriction-modification system R (restriction) subunit
MSPPFVNSLPLMVFELKKSGVPARAAFGGSHDVNVHNSSEVLFRLCIQAFPLAGRPNSASTRS